MARNVCFISEELKPAVVMVIVQVASTGSNFMYKIAMANGMGIQTIILYKLLFATVFMAPIAFFTERNCRPRFTWMIALDGFLSALFGATLGNYLYVKSMSLTSATFVTAMFNLIPGFTLVLALIFRLEKLDVRNSAGKAKVLGTVLGSGGAMILTFVKGKKIKILSQHVDIIPLHNHASVPSNNVVGSLLALLSCLSFAIWLVIQTKMSHSYPCYSSIAVMCFTGSILTGVLAICTERELSSWMLGWDCRLLAVAYLGIVSSGLCVAAVFWSSMMKGPLFVSSFSPLGLVFTALAGSLFLKEELCLGSLIGSIIITIGLCLVIWGKGKEATASQDGETESRRDEVTDGSQAAPPISNKWGSSTI
ncbi:WAT1-related protein At1g25270 [Coffea arabica]|uniref:WAT1-related protein n=1 Tax=Coffea arabica TaxID=13443 RepID=A0A6P6TGL9_COFAR